MPKLKLKLLFVIESLAAAGAEKSLVSLLNELDYSKVDVDLQLFNYGGHFQPYVPSEVNLLPELPYFKDSALSLFQVFTSFSCLTYKHTIRRILYSVLLRMTKSNNDEKAKLFWQCAGGSVIPSHHVKYDCAIAYAQGVPTYYVASKVFSEVKIAWVNVTFNLNQNVKKFQSNKYKNIDQIVSVSKTVKEIVVDHFPEYAAKTQIIRDINSLRMLKMLSEDDGEGISEIIGSEYMFLSIGRLAYQKGFDMAIDAAETLRNRGVQFKWLILGEGLLRKELENLIAKKELAGFVFLIGVVSNTHHYIKNCDVYVQPSRMEGFGLALLEARSMLKPCVATAFDAVGLQIDSEINGLIVPLDGKSIADGIERMINDDELRISIFEHQQKEEFFNTSEVLKFYGLIGLG